MEKRLGRGLEELIKEIEKSVEKPKKQEVVQLQLDRIRSNPYQARVEFNEKKLMELAQSIKEKGVIQPIVVKPSITGDYVLIIGERRFRAAKLAGLETIPAIIRDIGDEEMALISLVENLQRENLNPVEEAQAFKNIIDKFNLTQEELARIVGKDRSVIANSIRLLTLPDEVLNMLISGNITVGHARALLGIPITNKQIELSRRITKEKLTVREIEEIVRRYKPKRRRTVSPDLYIIEDEIRKALGLKVKIKTTKKHVGKIEIHFHSIDEFDKVVSLLKRQQQI